MDTILLQNDRVSMTIVPDAGGKILELKDRRSGRNWLWRNPHLLLSRPQRSSDFARELDSGGWDEVLFSVKPVRIDACNGSIDAVPESMPCTPMTAIDMMTTNQPTNAVS